MPVLYCLDQQVHLKAVNRELRSRVSEQQVTKRTPPPLQEGNALDSKHCGPEILRKQSGPYFLFLDCM